MSTALISACVCAALAVSGASPTRAPGLPVLVGVRALAPAPTEATAPAPAPAPAPAEATAPPPGPAPAEATAPPPGPDPAEATAAPSTVVVQPAEPAPAPTVVVAPAPAPAPPPPEDRPSASGLGLIIAGSVAASVGGASLVFIALPSAIVRNVALSRADNEDALAFTSRKTRYERARRADDAMEAGFWIGVPLLVGGVAMLITGVVIRTRARAGSRLAATPGGISVRF
jgi:hypothetical protein